MSDLLQTASKSTGLRQLFFNDLTLGCTSLLLFLSFFTDKEDVSIQHLYRVIWGIRLVYNILFRLAIKISVDTAKHRDAAVVSELYEQSAVKHKSYLMMMIISKAAQPLYP